VNYRAATYHDVSEITELYVQFVSELELFVSGLRFDPISWGYWLADQIVNNFNYHCIVAENGKIHGTYAIEIIKSKYDSTQLIGKEDFWYVIPESRKSLIAGRLASMAKRWAKDSGAEIMVETLQRQSDDVMKQRLEKRGSVLIESTYAGVINGSI